MELADLVPSHHRGDPGVVELSGLLLQARCIYKTHLH